MSEKSYTGEKKRNRVVIIFVAVFLSAILIFGIVLGVIAAVKHANAVYSYNGTVMDKRVASFFASRYKVDYFSALRSEGHTPIDDEEFWGSEYKDGVSYRDNFSKLLDAHLKEILVANYIFDNCRSLTGTDKDEINKTISEVLDYKAGGSVEKFNEMSREYGFDYNSFKTAVTMYYKASNAFLAMFGENGVNISRDETVCGSYLNEYTHVSLIIVRESTELNSIEGEGDRNAYLGSEEKEKRAEYINTIHTALDAYKNDSDGKMTATAFENWLDDEENSATTWREVGYYFNENAEKTAEFAELFPDVVKKAYEMENYSFDEVEMTLTLEMEDGGEFEEKLHVFMYKYPPVDGAYTDEEAAYYWFSDFYSDAAVFIYSRYLNEYREGVQKGGSYDKFNAESIPLNIELVPRF